MSDIFFLAVGVMLTGTTVCLNGQTLTGSYVPAPIFHTDDSTDNLTLCDCTGRGVITAPAERGYSAYGTSAVLIQGNGIVNMTGGNILNIYTQGGHGGCGAGAWIDQGTFNMSGGTISGCVSHYSNGGGVYVSQNGTLNVSGAPVIKGNYDCGGSGSHVHDDSCKKSDVYLCSNKVINLVGALTDGAQIGVTCEAVPTVGNPVVITSGYSEFCTEDPSEFFFSNNENYEICWNDSHTEAVVAVNPKAEDTPAIVINYTDETLTGFDTNGSYAINGTDVAPTDGTLAVESYIGSEISIVKKASDINHTDSEAQSLTIPARPSAPTGISSTKASDNDVADGTITNVDSTMEYKAANTDIWQSVTDTQITGLAAGDYYVRYKATQTQFASATADVNIRVLEKYTITFVNYDNITLQSGMVTVGTTPVYSGETPTKPEDDMYSYTFAGWEPEITAVTENATYKAKFDSTPRVYNVTLEANGGTVENADNYKTYSYGTGLILPTPTREDYNFDGWYDNENFEGTAVTAVTAADTGNKTYYAKWTEKAPTEYLITFVNYDNTTLQSGIVAVGTTPVYTGETPTKPDDSKYSYTFTGWSPEIAEVSGIAVYAAQFERTPIAYSVELTGEGKATVIAPEAGTYALIFAAYDSNGVLKNFELQNISFDAAGEQEIEPETLSTNGAAKVKVMLWSDISEMAPKCGSDEMNLQ